MAVLCPASHQAKMEYAEQTIMAMIISSMANNLDLPSLTGEQTNIFFPLPQLLF